MSQTHTDLTSKIHEAAGFVRGRSAARWDVLMTLGSGLGAVAEMLKDALHISYGDIPHFASSAVASHAGRFVIGNLYGLRIAIMQGRVHFYEGHPMWQVTLPVRVARAMGAHTFVVTNAAGGINRAFGVADLMLINDHINFLGMAGQNPLMGPNDESLGPRFPEMTVAYDAQLRGWAREIAKQKGITLREGVYFGLSGPFFESPAELRFLRGIGADAVGMSTVNEVLAARHGGMRVLGFSGITNVARLSEDEGEPPTHDEVMAAAPKLAPKLQAILLGVLERLAQ